jgi:hypothetical protein
MLLVLDNGVDLGAHCLVHRHRACRIQHHARRVDAVLYGEGWLEDSSVLKTFLVPLKRALGS